MKKKSKLLVYLSLSLSLSCGRPSSHLSEEGKEDAEKFVRSNSFAAIGTLHGNEIGENALQSGSPYSFSESSATILSGYNLEQVKVEIRFTEENTFEILNEVGKVHELDGKYAYVTLHPKNSARTHIYTVGGKSISLPADDATLDKKLFAQLTQQVQKKKFSDEVEKDSASLTFESNRGDLGAVYNAYTNKSYPYNNGFAEFARDKSGKLILLHFEGYAFSSRDGIRRNTAALKFVYDVSVDKEGTILEIIPRHFTGLRLKLEK